MSNPRPFPRIGILGGGQLGRMMALAAIRMGIRVRLISPKDAGPMHPFAETTVGDWMEEETLKPFIDGCGVITVESEWAPAERAAPLLSGEVNIWPHPDTLYTIRHKGRQNNALAEANLPVPEFKLCSTREDAREAAHKLGFPVVFKQFEGSYDGYGNATVFEEDIEEAWDELALDDGLLVEEHVDFRRELSAIVARSPSGSHVVYPLTETVQRHHRCHAVLAPADLENDVAVRAKEVALRAVEVVNGVGITAVELFETSTGNILINELAPRPHNTGHYSIDACHTSQFENHVRAILDLPLGLPALRVPAAVMVNVLGQREGHPPETEGLREALAIPGASVHIYGKPDVRPTRKMGHVTVTATDVEAARERAEEAASFIYL